MSIPNFINKNNIRNIYIILILLLQCCQENKTLNNVFTSDNPTIDNDINSGRKIKITGTTDDKSAFESINIFNYSDFFAGRKEELSNLNLNDSKVIIIDSIYTHQIIELMMFGKKLYKARLFVTPGDSININIDNGKLQFTGTNKAHYNFYLELDSLNNQWSKNGYEGNINDYKAKSVALEGKREEFFKSYIEKHPEVSKEFTNQVQSELKYEYLYNLVAPRSIKIKGSNSYVNNLQGVVSTLENESNLADGDIIDFSEYFDNVKIEDFNKPELINNDYYKRSLVELIRHYFTNQEYVDYTEENFTAELEFIQKNLKGEIAKYATGRLIYDYYQKGFGQDNYNQSLMGDLIIKYNKQPLNSSYRKVISEVEEDLKLFNTSLPKKLLSEKLLTLNKDTITIGEIFKNTKGKLKIIDFWASWCLPCVSDIKNSKKIKNKITNKNNVDWIYISIERNSVDWIEHTKKLKDYLPTEHQYKILDNMKSEFLEFLKVRKNKTIEVPRFVAIDSENVVILNNAPRPSDSLTFKKALQKITHDKVMHE